jgi:hypothetical protein
VFFDLVLEIFQTCYLVSCAILEFEGGVFFVFFEHDDGLAKFECETHFGCSKDVVSGDDENIVFRCLQMLDMFEGIFFQR